jgi:hypothetical protein
MAGILGSIGYFFVGLPGAVFGLMSAFKLSKLKKSNK